MKPPSESRLQIRLDDSEEGCWILCHKFGPVLWEENSKTIDSVPFEWRRSTALEVAEELAAADPDSAFVIGMVDRYKPDFFQPTDSLRATSSLPAPTDNLHILEGVKS